MFFSRSCFLCDTEEMGFEEADLVLIFEIFLLNFSRSGFYEEFCDEMRRVYIISYEIRFITSFIISY